MAYPVSYITATQLIELRPSRNLAIVDVRDEERSYDGHIAGSWHYASDTFEENLSDLTGKIKDRDVVVFHCAKSQVRGPTCARRLMEHITTSSEKGTDKVPEIYILERGFNGWAHAGHPICSCSEASCKKLPKQN